MTFITDTLAKVGMWIIAKIFTPKSVKKVIAIGVSTYIKNIKNDNKTDWQDTYILPTAEPFLDALENGQLI